MAIMKKLLLTLACATLVAGIPACHMCCKKEKGCKPACASVCVDKEIAVQNDEEELVLVDDELIIEDEEIVYEEACQNGDCKRMKRHEDGEMYNKEY